MSFLIDTNVLSEITKPEPDRNVVSWLATVDEWETFVSVGTLAELRRGVELLASGAKRDRLEAWLRGEFPRRFGKRLLDVTPPVAERWGSLMVEARRSGIALSVMDGFIAATALVHGLRVVTRNISDFAPLDIPVMDPWRPATPSA